MIKKFICKVFNLVPQSRYEELHNALNNEISQLQKQLKENADQYQNDLASLHAQIERLKSEKKALEEELSQSNKRIAELTKANEILSHRIKDLESAISEERGNVQSKEIIIKSLKSENDSLKESVEKLESLLKKAEENLKGKELEYNNSIGRIEKEHYNLYQENLKNINTKNSLEEALKKQKEVFESEQNIKSELTLSNDTLSHRIKELEGSYEKLSKINAELTQSNDILSHRIKDFEKAISKERSNVLSKEINIKSLKSENDSLKESVEKLESLLKKAEENLKEKELEYNNSIGRIEKEHYNLYQENLKNINAKNSLEEALKKQKEVFESEQNIKSELTLLNEAQKLQIKNLQNKCDKYKGQIIYYTEQEERQLKEHTSIVEQLQQELIGNKKAIEEKTAIIESQELSLIKQSREIKEINENNLSLKKEITNLNDELSGYKKSTENKEQQVSSTKTIENNNTFITTKNTGTQTKKIETSDNNYTPKYIEKTDSYNILEVAKNAKSYQETINDKKIVDIDPNIKSIIEKLSLIKIEVSYKNGVFYYISKKRGKERLFIKSMEEYNNRILLLYDGREYCGYDMSSGNRISDRYKKKGYAIAELDTYFANSCC